MVAVYIILLVQCMCVPWSTHPTLPFFISTQLERNKNELARKMGASLLYEGGKRGKEGGRRRKGKGGGGKEKGEEGKKREGNLNFVTSYTRLWLDFHETKSGIPE